MEMSAGAGLCARTCNTARQTRSRHRATVGLDHKVNRVFALVVLWCSCGFAGITVTESNARRLSFVFDLENFSTGVEQWLGRQTAHVSFGGQNCDLRQDDGTVVPGLSVCFGVPPKGSVSVGFAALATRRIPLACAPRKRPASKAAPEELEPAFGNPWVSHVQYSMVRGYRAGQVFLRPCIYDERTGTLTVLEKGSCTIEFPPTGVVAPRAVATRSHFIRMLKSLFLNFDVAQAWRRPSARPLAKGAAARTFSTASKMLAFTVGDGHSGYNECTTDENGVVKISGSNAGMFAGEQIARIALFGSIRRALDPVVPSRDSIPEAVVEIPLARFDLDGDGVFDSEDYVLGYVTGTSGWFFDADSGRFVFERNPYDDYRHYWLLSAAGGRKSLAAFFQPASPGAPRTTFEDHLMYRRILDLSNRESTSCEQSGTSWFWRVLDGSAATFDQAVTLAGAAGGGADSIRVGSNLRSTTGALAMSAGATAICTACDTMRWYGVASWPSDTVRLAFTDQSTDGKAYFELKSLEVKYRRRIDMTGLKHLRVFSSCDPGIVSYRLSSLPDEPCYVLRIPPDESAASLIAALPAGTQSYAWADTGALGVQYVIAAVSGLKASPQMNPWYRQAATGTYELAQLRAPQQNGDFVVITDSVFLTEATRLARHKQSSAGFGSPRVVLVDAIMREFAGGTYDPTAIRNFLLYATSFWSSGGPDYAVLLGNGHYDYKGYRTAEEIHVPTAELSENCMDDFFAYMDSSEDAVSLTPAPNPDIFIGRLPCASLSEAQTMVDKIIETEGSEADWGAWRNRVLLVADDDRQGPDHDPIAASNPHHRSSEDVEDRIMERRESVDIRKVYLFEYEWNDVFLKPEAQRALINEINNGVSIVNYFGHGSDDRWADEGLLALESMSSLANKKRYPLFLSFSCSVGRFDIPGHDCLSDLLMKAAQAGAGASIASTRKAYASDNEKLGESFFSELFITDSAYTLGQAYALAKAANRNKNQKNYTFFGDPSIRLIAITDTVALSVYDRNGVKVDTLKALQQGVKVRGAVYRNGVLNTAFGASGSRDTVQIGLYNPPQDSARRKDGGAEDVSYRLPGTPVFIARTGFSGGKFEQTIFLPRNLFFNTPGVKLVAYAWHGHSIGLGLKKDIVFSGTDPADVSDSTGPRIMVRPVYANQKWNTGAGLTDRLVGMLPLECEINLYDESGIDVIGTGPDEGLTLEVAGAMMKQNINHKFLFDEGDFRNGSATVTFEEGDLEDGEHEMIVSAQDMLGNVSRASIVLEVVGMSEFKLGHVFNYPNPFRMGQKTRFYFYPSNTYANDPSRPWYGTIQASIRVYTLSGKLIQVIRDAGNGQEWDGRDRWGNQLAPNVYLYRVVVDVDMLEVQRTERSPIKKLVIRPPH